jgi:hypothetical protein
MPSSSAATSTFAPNPEGNTSGRVAGAAAGAAVSSEITAAQVKFVAQQGHGFAAEQANDQCDRWTGRDAAIVGDDNAKNGADRVVDGIQIQSKYCQTGEKCIAACFSKGRFRYVDSAGRPMQIEVPADKYEAAVKAMEKRIAAGELPGVTNSEEARSIVRQGHITYEQAKNIAQAGTIEGLKYDAVEGVTVAAWAGGISMAVTLLVSILRGESVETALKKSVRTGLAVGGRGLVGHVLASQLGRTGVEKSMRGFTDWTVKQLLGSRASADLSKIMRGTIVYGGATAFILLAGEVVPLARGRQSGAQAAKNVLKKTSEVAGGIVGGWGGAVAGAAIGSAVPGVGTAVGGALGRGLGTLGGGWAAEAASAGLDMLIEDDADEMLTILDRVFSQLATDHLLSDDEAEAVFKAVREQQAKVVGDLYKAKEDRPRAARQLLEPLVEQQVKKRHRVPLPLPADMQKAEQEAVAALLENKRKINQLLELCEGLDDDTAWMLLEGVSGWDLRRAVGTFHDYKSRAASCSATARSA